MNQCNNSIIYSAELFHVGVRLILIYLSLLHFDNTSEFPARFHLGLPYNAGISVNTTPFCHLFESLKGNYTQFFAKTEEAAPWFIFRIPHICVQTNHLNSRLFHMFEEGSSTRCQSNQKHFFLKPPFSQLKTKGQQLFMYLHVILTFTANSNNNHNAILPLHFTSNNMSIPKEGTALKQRVLNALSHVKYLPILELLVLAATTLIDTP